MNRNQGGMPMFNYVIENIEHLVGMVERSGDTETPEFNEIKLMMESNPAETAVTMSYLVRMVFMLKTWSPEGYKMLLDTYQKSFEVLESGR